MHCQLLRFILLMNQFHFLVGYLVVKRDIGLGGVSSNSIVDLINLDDYLITLTTSRQLKLWNLAKHQYVSSTSLHDRLDEDIC